MASAIDELLRQAPYAKQPGEHRELLCEAMGEAIRHHYANCSSYAKWFRRQGADPEAAIRDLAEIPYLPVSIFKRLNLQSVEETDIVRVLRSSATSSQTPSRVVLDRVTRDRQMRTLATLLSALMGSARRPFVVLDAAAAQGADVELSARVAGMRGYLMMASETHHVFETPAGQLELNEEKLREIVEGLREPICVIGYTYVLYQHVVAPLLRTGRPVSLPAGSMVVHFGGWKRLEKHAVDRTRLNADTSRVFGVPETSIRDIYGFTEQLGVIYPDDGRGVRLAPVYSDVIVRHPVTLESLPDGAPGLLEFLTPLPHSYPGIAVLLDDMGRIVSRDEERDGRYGTRFEVLGRAKGVDVRGCGDTLAEQVYQVQVQA